MPAFALAQLEGVFVETYYVADSLDQAEDTSGSFLKEGEVTYRVFLDLAPGSRLTEIYGDATHPFQIASTRRFFNHNQGRSFSYDFPAADYEVNTVALDSYLTIGKNGRRGSNEFFGVPKPQDTNESFIGGQNNDLGLLANNNPLAGIPLTEADGLDTLVLDLVETDFLMFGIDSPDSSIVSIDAADSALFSNDFILRCTRGVYGVNRDSNYVLIAQLTTPGELSLSINAVVVDSTGAEIRYVSTNVIDGANQVFASFLNYPPACGCTDPNYIEFNSDFSCSEDGACQNRLVMGCMDEFACNYDTAANFNVQSLCCYPGFCQDRDLEEVCPHIKGESFDIDVFPNPAEQYVTLQIISGVESDTEIDITNYSGVSLYSDRLSSPALNFSKRIDTSSWAPGVYHVRVKAINKVQHSILVKL
jgi:hypothetical protein